MAELSVQQFEQIPEFLQSEYEQVGEVYKSKDSLKAEKLKGSLNALDLKMRDIERNEAEKITNAEKSAFERLKKEGKTDEIVADLERRHGETLKGFQERFDKMTQSAKNDKRSSVVSELANDLATEAGRKTFSRLIESRIDYDPETGKTIFLNDDGSASGLDLAGFKAEVVKSEIYAPVLKATVNTGGIAKGNVVASGAKITLSSTQKIGEGLKSLLK